MLFDNIRQYFSDLEKEESPEIYKEEKEYAEKHGLLFNKTNLIGSDQASRFFDAYIERCDKESENTLKVESPEFLNQPITYLKKHKNEFLYLESKWFALINTDAVSLEVDDVFGTYDVMLGLKIQKKFAQQLREQMRELFDGGEENFELLFSNEDGLWNVNFDLNFAPGFKETMSFNETFQLVYHLVFRLLENLENKQ